MDRPLIETTHKRKGCVSHRDGKPPQHGVSDALLDWLGSPAHHQREKVVHHRTATGGNEKQQTQEASGVTTLGIAFPEASELTRVPPRGVEFSRFSAENGQFLNEVVQRVVHEPSPLARAISLANSGLPAAAAGETLAAISCWLRDLAQLHNIDSTIDSQSTLCQVVDALASRKALSRTQAAQVDKMVDFLSACVYGAPRSSQSLSAILESAADLLAGK